MKITIYDLENKSFTYSNVVRETWKYHAGVLEIFYRKGRDGENKFITHKIAEILQLERDYTNNI